jgi:hypothetical protein
VKAKKATTLCVLIILCLLQLAFACQPSKEEKALLAKYYPDYIVFNPTKLAQGQIAIEDDNAKFGQSVDINKLEYSNNALLLIGKIGVASEFNVKNLSAQIIRHPTVTAPGCSTTWVYADEIFITGGQGDCLLLHDPELFASYQQQTKMTLPTKPVIQARLAPHLTLHSIFRCKYTVSGTTTCNNFCNCVNCINCAFVSKDGQLTATVPQPTRNPTSISQSPCNSKSECGR